MNPKQTRLARSCLDAAYDGSMAFPAIVGALIDAGFEGYGVDYRAGTQTFYTLDGAALALSLHPASATVRAAFDAARIAELVRWAQSGDPAYSYAVFSAQAMGAGCAGYLVSFSGRRVVYYGRTAETWVEHFPD